MNTVVVVAAIIRLVWTIVVVPYFATRIDKPAKPLTRRGYTLVTLLGLVNVILIGCVLGWW